MGMNSSGQINAQVLIVGADSLIGRSLADHFRKVGIPVVKTSRRNGASSQNSLFLDLSKDISAWQPPANISLAFWCAAVTSQEACLKKPQQTRTINVVNTCHLARKFAAHGIFNIFISSNLVFDGSVPYQLQDKTPCPTTEYGRQKAEAERIFLNMGKPAAIVRLTKVLAPGVPLFHNWIRSLKTNMPIHPFSDLKFSPIPLGFTINVLLSVAEQRISGIVQVSGNGDLTYAQAAMHIAKIVGADSSLIQPVKASESGVYLESVPAYTTLDTARLEQEMGVVPPNIWQTIEEACDYV